MVRIDHRVIEDLESITGLLVRLLAHQRRHDYGPRLHVKPKGDAARSNDERRPAALSEARLLTLSPRVAKLAFSATAHESGGLPEKNAKHGTPRQTLVPPRLPPADI